VAEFGLLLMVVAVGVSAIVQIFTDPRITGTFIAKSLVALAVYAGHVAVGIVVMVYLLPRGPDAAIGVPVAFLGWVGLGALGLIRFAPRLREPPRFLLRFGLPDLLCLALIAFGILHASGAWR
jgi:hypothetical protein